MKIRMDESLLLFLVFTAFLISLTNFVKGHEMYDNNYFFSKIWGSNLLTWESLLDIQTFKLVSNYAFFLLTGTMLWPWMAHFTKNRELLVAAQ